MQDNYPHHDRIVLEKIGLIKMMHAATVIAAAQHVYSLHCACGRAYRLVK